MSRSLWTRDLLDNPIGRVLRGYVFPLFLLGLGTVEIATQQATYKRFVYSGADAVCIGIGTICIGVPCALVCNPWCAKLPSALRWVAGLGCGLGFIVTFGIALLGNL
jgi:hypothetical protein